MPLIVRREPRVYRPRPLPVPKLLGVREAAVYLSLSPDSVRNLAKHGRITGTRPAGIRRLLFDVEELDRFVIASRQDD